MKILQKYFLFFLVSALFLGAAAKPLAAQGIVADPATRAREFTRTFYRWYLEKDKNRTVESVLLNKKDVLAAPLYQALKADKDAQAKVPDDIVGLDFDPFLNAQDIPPKIEVGEAVAKGQVFWVPVYGFNLGKLPKKPDLNAEVSCTPTACQFVNFHYGSSAGPQNENLLSILKALEQGRAKPNK